VIVDNDFSGDPDDLFQLVHHVLSPSVEIPFVIGSHLPVGDAFDPSRQQADNAARVATELLELLGRSDIPVLAGSNDSLVDASTPQRSPAAHAIVAEARRDSPLPLFFCAGAGLTALASALLMAPDIADRLTLVWIGGVEHAVEGAAPPPPGVTPGPEYNTRIDVTAAQFVFRDSTVPVWQVPRDAYRQVLVSDAELDVRVRATGDLGRRLADSVEDVRPRIAPRTAPETYVLGDSPLVLLTALQSFFQPDPTSSRYVLVPRPEIRDDGSYLARPERDPIRVYVQLDVRLLLEDFYAKLTRLDRDGRGSR
jgi:inosine-uridine nucleoside N-ribohydrolase